MPSWQLRRPGSFSSLVLGIDLCMCYRTRCPCTDKQLRRPCRDVTWPGLGQWVQAGREGLITPCCCACVCCLLVLGAVLCALPCAQHNCVIFDPLLRMFLFLSSKCIITLLACQLGLTAPKTPMHAARNSERECEQWREESTDVLGCRRTVLTLRDN